MVDALWHPDVYLGNSGHQPASGLLDWNCHCACLVNSVRGNFTSDLCLPISQRRRIPLASAPCRNIWDRRNLYADEPAFRRALSNTGPGGVSSRRRNLGAGSYFGTRGVRHAGWVLFDGIVTLILGILIWAQWPSSSVWVMELWWESA